MQAQGNIIAPSLAEKKTLCLFNVSEATTFTTQIAS